MHHSRHFISYWSGLCLKYSDKIKDNSMWWFKWKSKFKIKKQSFAKLEFKGYWCNVYLVCKQNELLIYIFIYLNSTAVDNKNLTQIKIK